MDLTEKILPRLEGTRKATISSYKTVANENGGYLELVLALEDREYTHRVFRGKGDNQGKQLRYFIQGLMSQMDINKETTAKEVLDTAKKNKNVFEITFTYSPQYNSMNLSFPTRFKEEDLDI